MPKGTRITGPARTKAGKNFAKRYRAGESVRTIAAATGHSYGFVHAVLQESGTKFRSRGGVAIKKAGK